MEHELMNIEFGSNEIEMIALQEKFNSIGEDAVYLNHYELALATPEHMTASLWRMFLTDPRVQKFLSEELTLLQQTSVLKMMKNIDQSRSTGQAQLLNTLVQQSKDTEKKSGPIFIYSYVPLNEEECYAPNLHIEESDPFKITDES